MKYNLLIAGCEPLTAKGLKFIFEHDGYNAVYTFNMNETKDIISKSKIDVIITEPSMNDHYEALGPKYNIPVILIANERKDMETGGEFLYYVFKPLNIQELKLAVQAIIRKDNGMGEMCRSVYKFGDLCIDTGTKTITIGKREIDLTYKEYEILLLLVKNRGKIFKREELLKLVWDESHFRNIRTVDVHIRRLREKPESDPSDPLYIVTSWGEGYCFKG